MDSESRLESRQMREMGRRACPVTLRVEGPLVPSRFSSCFSRVAASSPHSYLVQ